MRKILALTLFIVGNMLFTYGQQIKSAAIGDNVQIQLDSFHGEIQWQISQDGAAWSDLPGMQLPTMSRVINTLPVYFRAAIVDGTCAPHFSAYVKFEQIQNLPNVTTQAVTNILQNSATLHGIAEGEGILQRGFVYASSSNPTLDNSVIQSGSGSGDFTETVYSLISGTQFYVRAFATTSLGTSYGNEVSFFTLTSASSPTVSTAQVTEITQTSAICGGTVLQSGGAAIIVRGVVYSTTPNPTRANGIGTQDGTGTGMFVSTLSNLVPNVQYYVRAYATNAIGTSYGAEQSFKSLAFPATVSTDPPINITTTSASVSGLASSDGGAAITSRGFVYGKDPNPTIANTVLTIGAGTGSFQGTLLDLEPSTTYYVRSFAANIAGTAYGNQHEFNTLANPVLATVETLSASNVTTNSAKLNGEVTSDGGATVTSRGFVYSTTIDFDPATGTSIQVGNGIGAFNHTLTGLTLGTTYYFRSYAGNAVGTSYGPQQSFITLTDPVLATVETLSASNVTTNSARLNGEVTSDGGMTVTSRGFVYSTTIDFDPATGTSIQVGNGIGAFNHTLTGLTLGTTYYFRSYAVNAVGTSYGADLSFVTPVLPSVTTTAVPMVTYVAKGGNVTDAGSSPVTARGIVYSLSENPTLDDSFTSDGSGPGVFESSPAGTLPGRLYYYRAYATNSAGTAYGDQLTFISDPLTNTILMFAPHENAYYSEYIVMRRALESAGYTVELRSAAEGTIAPYMVPALSSIQQTAESLPTSNYSGFVNQFGSSFNTNWDEADNPIPAQQNWPLVAGKIQDVVDMVNYDALVIVGGTGALDYRFDGVYTSQGAGERFVPAADVEAAALKLNDLAVAALMAGKPVLAQCHGATLPAFWRVPDTEDTDGQPLGISILNNGFATGYPLDDGDTQTAFSNLNITYKPQDAVTVSTPNPLLITEDGGYKIVTSRDWYPQTVAHAARTLLNILQTYVPAQERTLGKNILLLHGGAVDQANCNTGDKTNDVPCNYGFDDANLPADFNDLMIAISQGTAHTVTAINLTSPSPFDGMDEGEIDNYLSEFDVIVFFKHWSTGVTDLLQKGIIKFADNGGGVLGIHHAIYNDVDGELNKDRLVNELFGVGSAVDGWGGSRETFDMYSTNVGHFISTYGIDYPDALPYPEFWRDIPLNPSSNESGAQLPIFSLFDEVYSNTAFVEGTVFGTGLNETTPLFSNSNSVQGAQSHTAGFVKWFDGNFDGKVGKVAFFIPGESKSSFASGSMYRQILQNSIIWLGQSN